MKKVSGLLAFVVLALLLGCSSPADQPATNFVAFLDKHKAAINAGTFDAKAFEAEGKPLVDELAKHVDPKEKQILMTEKVLAEWNRATTEFETAADKMASDKGNPAAVVAYLSLISVLKPEGTTPPSNG
jgi:hypothetical protein